MIDQFLSLKKYMRVLTKNNKSFQNIHGSSHDDTQHDDIQHNI